jgi:hypothetical protein
MVGAEVYIHSFLTSEIDGGDWLTSLPDSLTTEKNLGTHGTEGTRWRGWLRHCATSRKVAGSIPDGVIGIFHRHNPSSRNMALRSTQPLTEVSNRNIS